MRRCLCLAALAAVAALAWAPAAWAQSGDLDCSHFATREAPQAILDAHPAGLDIYALDADGDGVACEALGGGALEDGTAASVPASAQQYQAPAAAGAQPTAEAGAAPLPGTGGPPLLLIPAAVALVVVSGGAVLGLLAGRRSARRGSS